MYIGIMNEFADEAASYPDSSYIESNLGVIYCPTVSDDRTGLQEVKQ